MNDILHIFHVANLYGWYNENIMGARRADPTQIDGNDERAIFLAIFCEINLNITISTPYKCIYIYTHIHLCIYICVCIYIWEVSEGYQLIPHCMDEPYVSLPSVWWSLLVL